MKHIHLLAGVAAALVLAACGGSGSSNSSNSNSNASTSTSTIPSGARIEAVVLNPTTYDTAPNGQKFIIQDPSDIEAQDQIQFQLVYYDKSNNRIVIPTNQWIVSDTAGTYGTITYNSGVFDASNAETSSPQIVSVVYQGKLFSNSYQVLPRQVRLRGTLLSDSTHQPVSGVEIDFYGPQNPTIVGSPEIFLGKVTTAYNGTFRASIPPTATGFTLLNSSFDDLPNQPYQRYYDFLGQYLNTGDTNCLANLPMVYTNGEYFLADYTNSNVETNGTILIVPKTEATPTTTCG